MRTTMPSLMRQDIGSDGYYRQRVALAWVRLHDPESDLLARDLAYDSLVRCASVVSGRARASERLDLAR